jgi:hypothetical protein
MDCLPFSTLFALHEARCLAFHHNALLSMFLIAALLCLYPRRKNLLLNRHPGASVYDNPCLNEKTWRGNLG